MLVVLVHCAASAWPRARRIELRETVREMFHHGYGNYMRHAFPHDELRPLSRGYTDSLVELGNVARPTRERYSGVALTLIDSLDTLAVLGNASEFSWAVRWVSTHVSFDQDADVSLFETNIRVLGGLLSAHLIAQGELRGAEHLAVAGYDGGLLRLAQDLGGRLLSAFHGGCGKLPRTFVNLRGKVPRDKGHDQCTAGVGTLLLEMGVLSRLTGDAQYEEAALCALRLLWSKRSPLNLLGNTLDVASANWRNANAGIGAGIDSFYEYLLKGTRRPAHIRAAFRCSRPARPRAGYLVFGRPELFEMWNASYAAVEKHLRVGAWYAETNMHRGRADGAPMHFDALQAFWPALQVVRAVAQGHRTAHAREPLRARAGEGAFLRCGGAPCSAPSSRAWPRCWSATSSRPPRRTPPSTRCGRSTTCCPSGTTWAARSCTAAACASSEIRTRTLLVGPAHPAC